MSAPHIHSVDCPDWGLLHIVIPDGWVPVGNGELQEGDQVYGAEAQKFLPIDKWEVGLLVSVRICVIRKQGVEAKPGPALLKSDYTSGLSRNLVELAYVVQTLIGLYQHNNPECKSSAVIQRWVLEQLMTTSRGHANPKVLEAMISLERSAYTPDTDIMQWAI